MVYICVQGIIICYRCTLGTVNGDDYCAVSLSLYGICTYKSLSASCPVWYPHSQEYLNIPICNTNIMAQILADDFLNIYVMVCYINVYYSIHLFKTLPCLIDEWYLDFKYFWDHVIHYNLLSYVCITVLYIYKVKSCLWVIV